MSRSIITRLTVTSLLILFVTAAGVFFMGGSHIAHADPPTSAGRIGGGAHVYKGFGCWVALGFHLLTHDTHEVITPSGDAELVCKFETASPPPQTLVFSDFGCLTSLGATTDSQAVFTAGGEVTVTCHYHHT